MLLITVRIFCRKSMSLSIGCMPIFSTISKKKITLKEIADYVKQNPSALLQIFQTTY